MIGVKGKRIIWTIEMRGRAVDMRIAGKSLSAIGRELGVSHAAVRSMLERELTTPFDRARNQALRRAYSPRGSVMKGFEI